MTNRSHLDPAARARTAFTALVGSQRSRTGHASSLFDHDLVAGPVNCLALAVAHGREPSDGEPGDDLVFFSAPHGQPGPGHVVLRCAASGAVREPGSTKPAAPTVESYAVATDRQVLTSAPVAAIRAVLQSAPGERGACLREIGPSLGAIARDAFGAGGPPIPDHPVVPNGPNHTPPQLLPDDQEVRDWLASLGNAISAAEKKELLQTAEDAKKVLKYFSDNLSKSELKDPPPAIKAAWDRLMSSSAIRARLDTNPGKGVSVDLESIHDFIYDLDDAADNARASWQAYKQANPDADPLSLKVAADASILQANLPILDQADKPNVDANGNFSWADIHAIAGLHGPNAGLPDPLQSAARYFDTEPTFDDLSGSFANPATPDARTVNDDNLGNYVENDASGKYGDTMDGLYYNAVERAIRQAGGDPDVLNPSNFFGMDNDDGPEHRLIPESKIEKGDIREYMKQYRSKHPDASLREVLKKVNEKFPGIDAYNKKLGTYLGNSDASPADKAATLIQLAKTLAMIEGGTKYNTQLHGRHAGVYVPKEIIENAIDSLSADPEVQKFLQENAPGAMHEILSRDPDQQKAVQDHFNELTSGNALDHIVSSATGGIANGGSGAIGGVVAGMFQDPKDAPPITVKINKLISDANTDANALGLSQAQIGDKLRKMYADASPETQKAIEQAYDDLTSGDRVRELIQAGVDPQKAISQASMEKSAYDMILPPKMALHGTEEFGHNVMKIAQRELGDGLSVKDMMGAYGLPADLKGPEALKFVKEHYRELVPPGTANPPTPASIVAALRGLGDEVRSVRKLDVAISKLLSKSYTQQAPQGVKDAYSRGALHAASAIFLGAAILFREHDGSTEDKLLTAGQSIQMGGLMLDASAKAWARVHANDPEVEKRIEAAFAQFESNPTEENWKRYTDLKMKSTYSGNFNIAETSEHLQNAGTILGAVGAAASVGAGGLFLNDAIKSGDPLAIGLTSLQVGVQSIGDAAAFGEGISYVVQVASRGGFAAEGAAGAALASDSVASFAAVGAAANIVAGVLAFGLGIWGLIEQVKTDQEVEDNQDLMYQEERQNFDPVFGDHSGLFQPYDDENNIG